MDWRNPLPFWTSHKDGPVVVLGSINQDLITLQERLPAPGETVAGRRASTAPGGKGLNQAVAARRAGATTVFVGRVGNDQAGRASIDFLSGEGIDVSRVEVSSTEGTGTAVVSVLDDGENAIVVVPGANDSTDWSQEDADAVDNARALVTQLERPLPLVEHALTVARAKGTTTVLTPAPVSAAAAGLLPLVDLLLLNEHEARLLGADPDAIRAAAHLSLTAALVVMTRGASSTIVAHGGEIVHEAPVRSTAVVDTTGAGDCFAGTLVARLVAGDNTEDSLTAATVAASLSVGKAGAAHSIPRWSEVEAARA